MSTKMSSRAGRRMRFSMDLSKVFEFDGQRIRTAIIDEMPMFHANDCAKALGYENPSTAIDNHCKNKRLLRTPETGGSGIKSTRRELHPRT